MTQQELVNRLEHLALWHKDQSAHLDNREQFTESERHEEFAKTVQAAVERIKTLSGPPAFLDEALNSGDGTYKP